MRCRRHNYVYTQGYFYCTKCGHRRYHSHTGQRKSKKIIMVPIVIALVGVAVYFNSDMITNFSNNTSKIINENSSITPTTETKTESKTTSIPKTQSTPKTTSKPISDQPVINSKELEQQIHNLINEERQSRGLKPLTFDTKLASIAREHSIDMVHRNFFAHENPDGEDPTARGLQVGYTCHKELGNGYYMEGIAENIFQNNLYNSFVAYPTYTIYDWNTQEELAQSTVNGWMHSSGHKQNILTKTYDREGIGVALEYDYKGYWRTYHEDGSYEDVSTPTEFEKVYITEDFC